MTEKPINPLAGREPEPQPPREPEAGECCQSGCDPCVYDRYWEALECYERVLQAWQARNAPEAPT